MKDALLPSEVLRQHEVRVCVLTEEGLSQIYY